MKTFTAPPLLLPLLLILIVYNEVHAFTANEEIVGVGITAHFIHETSVIYNNQTLYAGKAILKVSRPDIDTLVIRAEEYPKEENNYHSLVRDSEESLVLRTLEGRLSSVLKPKSENAEWTINYLRSMASVLFVYKDNYPRSYHMVTDLFGTCEVTITKQGNNTEVTRDLTRCSHSSNEVTNSIHFLPLFHLGMDFSGSLSSCLYLWTNPKKHFLNEVTCKDEIHIAERFSHSSEIYLQVDSSIKLKSQNKIESDVYDSINKATEMTDLILQPMLNKEDEYIENDEMKIILSQLCATSRDHLTKDGLLLSAQTFHALSRARNPPNVLKYPCPANIRRSVAFAAALVGGPRYISFVHDQMMLIIDEGLELLPSNADPLIAVAISNLAEPNINPRDPTPIDFFLQRDTVYKLEKIIEMLLVAGSNALPGVTNLLQKLRTLSPKLFEDTVIRAAALISPEDACAKGNAEEATRILHAVSTLSVRPTSFVASLRPCFATEDVGVQVAAMMSLRKLDCQTPGVLELQQLALESPSDPEIRIAAFKGIINCLPGRPSLSLTLQAMLDPETENYSKQVSSFIWSYIQSIFGSSDPTLIDLQLELEDIPDLMTTLDPVSYDPRQHSRHLEHNWILDPRTSITGTLEMIWGRASPAPRSILLGVTLFHDGLPYDVVEGTFRFTGLERALSSTPGLRNAWKAFMHTKDDLWSSFKQNVEHFWRGKREINHNSVNEFVQQVIARIPGDFQASGSSIEFSLSLFGLPAYHFHDGKIDTFLSSIPEFLSYIKAFNYHSEMFSLLPFMDNTIELATSGGVPISLGLSTSGGIQSLISHYTDQERGSADFIVSGGIVLETEIKVGVAKMKTNAQENDIISLHRPITDVISENFSHLSTKQSWSLDLPFRFSYEAKPKDLLLKFRRPSVLPHFIWQETKTTFLNRRPFPFRLLSDNCLFGDESVKLCSVGTEDRIYTDKLEVLNNHLFKPYFFGIKLDMPRGYESVLLQIEGPEESSGRTNMAFRAEIPTEDETLNYEAIFVSYTSPITSAALTINSLLHKYYIKGYWTFSTHEKWEAGIETSVDQSKRELKFQILFPRVANQRMITLTVTMTSPDKGEEDILKAFMAVMDFSESSSIEISGSTLGSLAEVVEVKVAGDLKRKKRESSTELTLKELKLRVAGYENVIVNGKWSKSITGIDTSLSVEYSDWLQIQNSFSYTLTDLGSSAHMVPEEVRAALVGGSFAYKGFVSYSNLTSPATIGLSGTINKGEIELDINCEYESESVRLLFFLVYESSLNFKSIISVEYPSKDIAWTGTQELVWDYPEYKVGLNGTWSLEPEDHFGFLFHLSKGSGIDHSLTAFIVVPDQQVELIFQVSKAVADSYKHNIVLKMTPGREITMNTVVVSGKGPNVVTYGLSIDFKMDKWENVLRIVGTANCVNTYTTCAVNVVVAEGADQLGEFEVKYTGSISGISRTDISLVATSYLNIESSVDVIVKNGIVKFRLSGDVIPWQRYVKGDINVTWKSTNFAEAQFMAYLSREEEALTHHYSSSLTFDREKRTIFSRQELREYVNGNIKLWAAIAQGKIGITIINEKHFIKIAIATPDNKFYTASGEMKSKYVPMSLVSGNTVVAVDVGESSTYLLGWDLNMKMIPNLLQFNRLLAMRSRTNLTEEELIVLTTLGRLKTPSLGEAKLHIKARRSHVFDEKDPHFSNTVEARLVTEVFPELGRLNAKLTHNRDAYSLSTRVWSGSKSASIDSYGVSREGSMKSSASLTAIDPSSSWQILVFGIEGDHLGKFPFNFESSLEVSAGMHHEDLASFRALAQWTPSAAALNLGLNTIIDYIPGGLIFFKWTFRSFQSRISLLSLSTAFEAKIGERGNKFDVLFTFSYPNIYVNDIDSTLNFHLQKGELMLIPDLFILKSRISVNIVNHWILNIDTEPTNQQIVIMGAVIRPNTSASFSVELIRLAEASHRGKVTLVIDDNSHHMTVILVPLKTGEQKTIIIRSSLLPERNGYVFRVWKTSDETFEIGALWAEGSELAIWSHVYRLNLQSKYSKKLHLEEAKLEDSYIYKENGTELVSDNFFKTFVKMQENRERYRITIEFPNWSRGSSVDGTIHIPEDGDEITSVFNLKLPTNDHLVEARLSYGDSITNWRFGRIIYRHKLIKGVGHPLRLEFEANNYYGEKKKDFRFTLQKLFTEESHPKKGKPRKGGSGSEFVFKNFQGRFSMVESLSSKEYKISWETDDSRNDVDISLEMDSSGSGGHMTYERVIIKDPKNKESFLIKGIFKEFPSEVTCSITMEHVSIQRPRSFTFLHSFGEDYTEVLLDIFKWEEDQIIIAANRKQDEKSFRVGQFGNNFVQIFHKSQNEENEETGHQSILAEIGGQSMEIKLGALKKNEDEECQWLHIISGTPHMPLTHNTVTFCPRPNVHLSIQVLGIEEKEGPYLRMGEISGPGGAGLQLGGGRLHPLDTPPALTLTADVKERFIEILFDCQINSWNQLMEDFHSRQRVVENALTKFPEVQWNLKGTLALDKAIKDTHRLWEDVLNVLQPFKDEIMESMDEDLLLQMKNSTDLLLTWIDIKKDEVLQSIDDAGSKARKRLEEIIFICQKWIKQNEFYVHEVVDFYTRDLNEFMGDEIFPLWTRLSGGVRALRFNDNQSLFALTSRVMSSLHSILGRQKGVTGFVVNDVTMRIEQIVAKRMRWETIKKEVLSLVRLVEKVTPVTFQVTHDTAFKLQISPPEINWSDLRNTFDHLRRQKEYSRYVQVLKAKFKELKARVLYLNAWKVKGYATLIGWEQAISWDGRFLSPLLSNSCPHLLMMLTRSTSPIAITLHLLQDSSYPLSKVLTFISRNNQVTVDNNLMIQINGIPLQKENEVIGDLHIQNWPGAIRISSSEGVTLECQLKSDLCFVEIGKENFASTAGLFGVFDFETNTDFMTSAWERPASPSEWSRSWRIESEGECQDIPFHQEVPRNQEEKCATLFSGVNSPFSECLRTVPGLPYEGACRQGKRCSAEDAMKRECQRHFIDATHNQFTCSRPEVRLLLRPDLEVQEAMDVRLECQALGDPPVTNIQFMKETDILSSNPSEGIVLSHSSLVLQNMKPAHTGVYKCKATNSVGASESNAVQLKFKHKPICAHNRKVIVASNGEMVVLECKVKADPSEVIFHWSFNNGQEFIKLSESTYTSHRLTSRLKFVPKSEIDFGSVRCWAENEFGTQADPCQFEVNQRNSSAPCDEPSGEIKDHAHLPQEIVFIGDFSCFDSIKHIIQVLKKESHRETRLVMRYTSADDIPDSYNEFDKVIASFNANPLDLLATSIQKDFGKDSLKAIILFNCHNKECRSSDQEDVDKALLLSEEMREYGIHLFTITKEAIVLNEPNDIPKKVKRQLLGMDRRTSYLMSHARKKNLNGKRAIRKFLSLPENNLCAELSLQTDGALFSLRAMKKLKKSNHKRSFRQLVALRLLEGQNQDYLKCRNCACQRLCKLCHPIQPFESEILDTENSDEEDEEDDEDYFYN